MPKPHEPKHHACENCPHTKCTFTGQFTDVDVTDPQSGGHLNCKFFRCRAGHSRASREITRAAREPPKGREGLHPRWKKRTVDGEEVWTLHVDTVHKSGYITPEAEFVVSHKGKLHRTGQIVDPKRLTLERQEQMRAGLERAKRKSSGS